MKAKLGGLGGIKHFFVMHGEKLGVAVIALIALWFIYGALGRESLPADKEASKLNERITLARQNMQEFNWPKYKETAPDQVREVVPLSQTGSREIAVDNYLGPNPKIPWDSYVVPPIVRRTDPVLLEAQDLEASGGSGLLAFVDPAVRRQKMQEEAEKAAAREKKQQEESARTAEDTGRGGRGSRGGQSPGYGASDVYDPENPKRRPVVGMVRPGGVPLEGYEDVRIGHWAVINAKVPIKDQVKLYREVFENARGYDAAADLPQYLGYIVERAELRAGDEPGDLKWERVSVYDGKSSASYGSAFSDIVLYGKEGTAPDQVDEKTRFLTRDWVPGLGEIVDPRFMGTGPLVFPLPPLVGRDWSREATHSDIPLAADNFELEEEKQPEAQPEEKPEGEPTDMFARSAAGGGMAAGGRSAYGTGGAARGGYGMGGMRGEMGGGGYGMGGGMRGGYGMEGGMRGGYGGEMGGRGGMSGAVGSGFGPDGTPLVSDWLLRFFDFSVEPGKKYKYRVRLVLLDPNQTSSTRYVSADTLDSSVLSRIKEEKQRYRTTEWSKPSSTVTIPLAGSVYVMEAKPAADQFTSEPQATLLVQSFAKDAKGNAIQAAEDEVFQRGHVANMVTNTDVLVDQNRAIDPYKNFPFQTDITVADIRGGERLTRKDSRPARVLLMGPAGQLFVQDQIGDADVVETHKATFAKEPAGGAGGFMGGRGFERGGMGPGMGRGGR